MWRWIFWCKYPLILMLICLQISHFFDFHIPLTLNPSCMPHHNFSWPIQTLTASHNRACLMERSSWTASSRQSSLETHACRCGEQVQSRPGWRLSWECPCTTEPALKTSKVARYTLWYKWLFCCLFDSRVYSKQMGIFRCCSCLIKNWVSVL